MLGDLDNQQSVKQAPVMLFDLATGGHHASYIHYIIRYYSSQSEIKQLYIVVSPQFLETHRDIVQKAVACREQVLFRAIEETELNELKSTTNKLARLFKEWQLAGRYAAKLEAQHCLFMYLDTLQLPIAMRANFPCSFSGIFFRPTLHYQQFSQHTLPFKERVKRLTKKSLLYFALQNSQLKNLFCLDSFAIPEITKIGRQTKIIYLPDPVEIYERDRLKVEELKVKLHVESRKKILLFFGRLGKRKGIYQLIEAVKLLPIALCQQICLVLAGEIPDSEKLTIDKLLAELSETLPIQVVVCDRFIPDEEVYLYFQMSDAVLAPYQHHIGMSGILLLAAAAQKPVLSSNYGLMGELVLNNKLGLTVDSTSPDALSGAIAKLIDENYQNIFDISQMKNFAKRYSWQQFATTLISNIF